MVACSAASAPSRAADSPPRRPNHDTTAPTTRSPAQTNIARWKASIDACAAAAICSAVAPSRGGFSGGKSARTVGDDRVEARVERGQRRVERRADGDEDHRAQQRLADPRDRVVDGRAEPREPSRDRAHQRARQRRDDARDADAEEARWRQHVDEDVERRHERRGVGDRASHGSESTGRRVNQSSPRPSATARRRGTAATRSDRRPRRSASRAASGRPRPAPRPPPRPGRVAQDALEDEALHAEHDVQGAVDEERREVDRRERAATGRGPAARAGRGGRTSGTGRRRAPPPRPRSRPTRPGPASPVRPPRMRPNARPPTASAATSEPSQSNRRGADVSRDSGDVAEGRPTTRSARTGTLIRNAIRQPMVSTSNPPTTGPSSVSADVAAAQIPNARPRSGALEGLRDDRQCTRDEQRAGRSLEQPEQDQQLEVRGQPAQGRGHGEQGQADRVDPPPAVVIGQRAGEDEERGEDRQVAADDVGLALEDTDQGGRQFPADARQGDVDDGPVEEHGAGPDDRRQQGPALARRHCRAVSQIDSRGMPGPVALVGAGEFLPAMAEIDADLLASTGVARPRVVILPTASYPDGEEVFQRWASMGTAHFAALGAEVEPVLVRDRAGADDPAAAQAIGEADLIYLSGGKPRYLVAALEGTAAGAALAAAHERGAVLAGCSAGAMALAGHVFDFRVRVAPWPLRWGHGLALAQGVSVVPHYDALARAVLRADRAPGAARLRRARHRRGDRGRRPRRLVAGPRRRPGHGLARPPPRTVPCRGCVPGLTAVRSPGLPSAASTIRGRERTVEWRAG